MLLDFSGVTHEQKVAGDGCVFGTLETERAGIMHQTALFLLDKHHAQQYLISLESITLTECDLIKGCVKSSAPKGAPAPLQQHNELHAKCNKPAHKPSWEAVQ